jgi:ABC-type multidrug transport system fused ATPase/permease subunit
MNVQMPAIEFRHVFLSFDDHLVMDDVSFTLQHGEMIVLTGISESGVIASGDGSPETGFRPNLH